MKIKWAFGELKDHNSSVSQHETLRKNKLYLNLPRESIETILLFSTLKIY